MSTEDTLSPDAYVAAGTPLIALCAVFVALRCLMDFRVHRRLLIADYLSWLGFAFVTIAFSMNDIIIQRFVNPMDSLNWLNRMAVVITVLIAFELWTTKVPILLVYVSLFGIRKWLRWTCYACIAVSGVAYICVMAPTFMRCNPSITAATLEDLEVCTTGTTLTGVLSGFIALAEDVLILSLPMPLVRTLHLPRQKKLAVMAVFFSGILYVILDALSLEQKKTKKKKKWRRGMTRILRDINELTLLCLCAGSGIAASIASLYFKWSAYKGTVSDTLATMLCAVIEGTIAIMIGCAPSVKQFWSTMVHPPLSSYSPTRHQPADYTSSSMPQRSRGLLRYKKMGISEVDLAPLQPERISVAM